MSAHYKCLFETYEFIDSKGLLRKEETDEEPIGTESEIGRPTY